MITGSRLKNWLSHYIDAFKRRSKQLLLPHGFPVDSALRFSKEDDFSKWGHRLHIHGLDLRHIPSVEIFCNYIEQKYDRLDILINNAAQTVRRPSGFYAHLMTNEERSIASFAKNMHNLYYQIIPIV